MAAPDKIVNCLYGQWFATGGNRLPCFETVIAADSSARRSPQQRQIYDESTAESHHCSVKTNEVRLSVSRHQRKNSPFGTSGVVALG